MNCLKIASFFSLFFVAYCSWGYSDDGHKIVAKIAWDNLTPNTKQEVQKILGVGEQSFIDASLWADKVRGQWRYRHLKPLHYVNILDGHYNPKRDCKKGKCVVQAIEDFSKKVTSSDVKQRKLALRMLIHLIADIHQPLHAGRKEDLGGNKYPVKYKDEEIRLHKVWDGTLVDLIDSNWKRVITKLPALEGAELREPVAWAEQSHSLAINYAYTTPKNKELSEAYLKQATKVTAEQLSLAAWRLAQWLNNIWLDSNVR